MAKIKDGFVKKVLENKREDLKGFVGRMEHELEMANLHVIEVSKTIYNAKDQIKEINKVLGE